MRETIEIDEKGVYLIKTQKLTPRQIADKRRRIESRIAYYYRTNQEHADLIERNKKRIQNLETQRTELNDPMVTSIIDAYVEKRRFAQMKAEEFLEEFLGKEVYDELKKKRHIIFVSKDKLTYKIDLKSRSRLLKLENSLRFNPFGITTVLLESNLKTFSRRDFSYSETATILSALVSVLFPKIFRSLSRDARKAVCPEP